MTLNFSESSTLQVGEDVTEYRFVFVVIIGFLIFSLGVSGCVEIGGPDYSNEYESGSVVVKYTSSVESDNAQRIALIVNGIISLPKGDEMMIQQDSTTVYVHKDEETVVLKMETGFSNAEEITSTGSTLHNTLLTSVKGIYEETVELILINESGKEFKTIK